MNIREMHDVMSYLFADHDTQVSKEKRQVWFDQFKDVPVEKAMKAARLMTSRKSFGIPKAHDFREALAELDAVTTETWGEAWDKFKEIAHRYGYYQMDQILPELEKVSALAAQVMKTSVQEYLQLDTKDLPTFRAQFRQRYEALQDRDARARAMPADLRLEIENSRKQEPALAGTTALKLVENLKAGGIK